MRKSGPNWLRRRRARKQLLIRAFWREAFLASTKARNSELPLPINSPSDSESLPSLSLFIPSSPSRHHRHVLHTPFTSKHRSALCTDSIHPTSQTGRLCPSLPSQYHNVPFPPSYAPEASRDLPGQSIQPCTTAHRGSNVVMGPRKARL